MRQLIRQASIVDVEPPWVWPKLPGAEDYIALRMAVHAHFGYGDPYQSRVIILISLDPDPETKAGRILEAAHGFRAREFAGVFFVASFASPPPSPELFPSGIIARHFHNEDKAQVIIAVMSRDAVRR